MPRNNSVCQKSASRRFFFANNVKGPTHEGDLELPIQRTFVTRK